MTGLEKFGRISLFFTCSIFVASAIIFPISILMTEQRLQDVEAHQFRTAFVRTYFISSLAFIGVFGVILLTTYDKSETPMQLACSLAICLVFGIMLLNNVLSDFSSASNHLEEKLTRLQSLYYWDLTGPISNEVKDATDIWDRLQTEMKCCGVNSPEDWSGFAPKKYPTTVPISCYDLEEPMKSSVTPSGTGYDDNQPVNNKTVKVYEEGCAVMLERAHFVSIAVLIAVFCFGLFFDMLFIIIILFTKAQERFENSRKVAMRNCAYPTELDGVNNVKPVLSERTD